MTTEKARSPISDPSTADAPASACGAESPPPCVGVSGGENKGLCEGEASVQGHARAALEQGDLAWATRDLTQDHVDAITLIENLRVYQAELEIQNEELRAAQLDTERAVQRYLRLFSDMPVAGLVIDRIGRILEVNRVAGDLFGMRTQLKELETILLHRARAKGLRLVCEVADAVPAHLRGDAGRLRQVLVNLVDNAIKFTPSGEVEVRVEMCPPGERSGTGASAGAADQRSDAVRLSFSVRDTGIGIPADKLGLAISKQLVELMGGRIAVESLEGQGSTFRFDVRLQSARRKRGFRTLSITTGPGCHGAIR